MLGLMVKTEYGQGFFNFFELQLYETNNDLWGYYENE